MPAKRYGEAMKAPMVINTCDSQIDMMVGFEMGQPRIQSFHYHNAVPPGLYAIEEAWIRHVYLEMCKGNKHHACKALQISRATLYRKLREYGLCA